MNNLMNTALKSALSKFRQKDGELHIGGKSVSSIAQMHGTPLYVYDKSVIDWRHATLRDALPDNVKIYYSVKANPNPEIVYSMGQLYDGVDVASSGEMKIALNAGIDSRDISFTGPGKTIKELKFAIRKGIGCINIESRQEFEHIVHICSQIDLTAHICIRINPPFDLSQSGMKMGGGPKKFGIDNDLIPDLIQDIRNEKNIRLDGIHIFSGSQNLQHSAITDNFKNILNYADHLSSSCNLIMKTINLGGGFGIPYFANDAPLDIKAIGKELKSSLDTFQEKYPDTRLKIELGRFLIGECGIYLSQVLYRKISHGMTFIIINGGMHHHLAASGNFGQSLVRRPMPLTTANKLASPLEKVNVSGPLCTPLDTFGTVEIPVADVGDYIAVFNSGAYGYSASPLQLLSHRVPKEIVL